MKTLEDQMSIYAAYHQDARNKATHFVGVPLIQVFVAPIFLAAEVFFALGYKPSLHEAVQRRALEMRAQAGIGVPPGDLKSA